LLLCLYRARVDQPPVKRADERTIDPVVEAAVRLGGHPRVEEHEAAAMACVRLRGKAVPIAMREHGELRRTAEIARIERLFRLRVVVVPETSDALPPRLFDRRRHQYVSLFSIVSSAVARQSAMRWPACPSPYSRS